MNRRLLRSLCAIPGIADPSVSAGRAPAPRQVAEQSNQRSFSSSCFLSAWTAGSTNNIIIKTTSPAGWHGNRADRDVEGLSAASSGACPPEVGDSLRRCTRPRSHQARSIRLHWDDQPSGCPLIPSVRCCNAAQPLQTAGVTRMKLKTCRERPGLAAAPRRRTSVPQLRLQTAEQSAAMLFLDANCGAIGGNCKS